MWRIWQFNWQLGWTMCVSWGDGEGDGGGGVMWKQITLPRSVEENIEWGCYRQTE